MAKYIECEAALKAIHEEWDDVCNYDGSGYALANEMESVIYSVPAADVRPVVHGQWVRPKTINGRVKCFICSSCGIGQVFRTSFCPNCGAKMEVGT